jgi:hypothetical protein
MAEDNRPAPPDVTSTEPRDAGAGRVAGVSHMRAGWLVGLLFVIFVGVSGGGILYTQGVEQRDRARLERVQRQQDADMCALLNALLPSAPPAGPSSTYGQAQQRAVAAYRAHRC